MHICYFAQDYRIEPGANQSMLSLISRLVLEGNKVSVILIRKGNIEEKLDQMDVDYYYCYTPSVTININRKEGVNLIYLLKIIINYINIFLLSLKLKNKNIDLIHINKVVGCSGAYLAAMLNVPYVWHIREFMQEDYGRKFQHPKKVYKLMDKASAIIAVSQSIKDKYQKRINREISVIYNGIETKNISFNCENKFCSDKIRILMSGTIVEGKRQLDAIKAIHTLCDRYNIKLYIVGKIQSTDYFEQLTNYVNDNNLKQNIVFKEFTENLNLIRDKCDIGLLCSEKEAFGRVTIETMLSGMLFVGSDSGGTSELVNDGINGFLYKVKDIDSLVDALLYIFDNKNKMNNIINNAYSYAVDQFSMEKTYRSVAKVYKNVIDNRNEEGR